jgi:hypothetical protein
MSNIKFPMSNVKVTTEEKNVFLYNMAQTCALLTKNHGFSGWSKSISPYGIRNKKNLDFWKTTRKACAFFAKRFTAATGPAPSVCLRKLATGGGAMHK